MERSDQRRVAAWDALAEANLCASLAMLPGADVADTPHAYRVHTPVPHSSCNPVVARHLPTGDALAALIAETRAYYAARGTPYRWYLTPRTTPDGIGDAFVAHGFTRRATGNMAVDLAALPEAASLPDDCTIAEVHGAPQWTAWCRTFAAGYGLPAAIGDPLLRALSVLPAGPGTLLRHYLALLGDAPVATATLLLAGGAAGIYWVATVPEARGRGIGAAVTLAALRAGRADGMGVGVLQSTAMGVPVYRRLDFVDCPVWECLEEPTQDA